uniref:Uncharacterized protein n=1 Tax=Megaselia scalaris TaxID=36166 RepID=T1GFQ0_MEGSC
MSKFQRSRLKVLRFSFMECHEPLEVWNYPFILGITRRVSEEEASTSKSVEPQKNFSSFQDEDLKVLETVTEEKQATDNSSPPPPEKIRKLDSESTFTGSEDYYVDKKPMKSYFKVETLYKPACPEYKLKHPNQTSSKDTQITEEDFDFKLSEYNTNVIRFSKNVDYWIKLVQFQDEAPYKWTSLVLAEKKLDIIERALYHIPGNEELYKLYIEMINICFASYEVSKKLEIQISKNPTNYFLWNAYIMTSQCSMARCLVPDILKLYEKSMRELYKRSKSDDQTMLKMFKNVAIFLKQSGLFEQFFALLKLGLELNVDPNSFNFQNNPDAQNTLIEYEELVLKSGLPMTEIWLRIEKLRQNYYFLPCPPGYKSSSDPQRIVFNEDVCHYIYPLSNNENSFYMILQILYMLKFPIFSSSCFRNKFNLELKDSDGLEEYFLCKELVVGPTFLNNVIGHELYSNTLKELLLLCSECFKNRDEQKRILFLYLLLKFERLLLVLEKVSGKYNEEYGKKLRSKVKKILKKDENRNVLNFYSEYILMEYEMDKMDTVENIYQIAFASEKYLSEETRCSEVYYGVASYVEILLKKGDFDKALRLILGGDDVTDSSKLIVLRKLIEKVSNIVSIEKNISIMELEQYVLPDHFINLLKIRIYYQCLLGQNLEAIEALEKILQFFIEKNDRHQFLREEVLQILLKIMQWPGKNCIVSNVLFFDKISSAIEEFPENLFFLSTAVLIQNQPWYKIRKLLSQKSVASVIFQIVGIRIRFLLNREMYLDNDINECPWNKALYVDGCIYVPQEVPHLQDLLIEKQLRIYALPEELDILREDK